MEPRKPMAEVGRPASPLPRSQVRQMAKRSQPQKKSRAKANGATRARSPRRPAGKHPAGPPTVARDLRRQFVGVFEKAGRLTKKFQKSFEASGDRDVSITDLDDNKKRLGSFERSIGKLIEEYDGIREKIACCGDAKLADVAERADAAGFRPLLADMHQSLADQHVNAIRPLTNEDRALLRKHIANLLRRASIVHRLSVKLAVDVATDLASATPGMSPEHKAALLDIRRAFASLVKASVDFATDAKRDPADSAPQRVPRLIQAAHKYELAIDNAKAMLTRCAQALKTPGTSALKRRVETFVSQLDGLVVFDQAILENVVKALLAVVHPPKEAGSAASDCLRVMRDLQPKNALLLAECSAARGKKDRSGDRVPLRSIRDYGALEDSERIVVDVFRKLRSEQSPTAKIRVKEVVAQAQPQLRAQGLACSEGTIRQILSKLASDTENILFAEPEHRKGGHGGAYLYRLTVPAGEKYPRWMAPTHDPASSRAAALAPSGS